MGYETKLIIGQLGTPGISLDGDSRYFLRMATLDLCKCGYESELYKIGTNVNERNKVVPKYKDIPRAKVHWSNSFDIDTENITKSLLGEHNFESNKSYDIERQILGTDRETIEDRLDSLKEVIEGWESKVTTDSYGDELIAIPLTVVRDALILDSANHIVENEGRSYRRFDIALALVESMLKAFPEREVEKDDHDWNLYCVLWGY